MKDNLNLPRDYKLTDPRDLSCYVQVPLLSVSYINLYVQKGSEFEEKAANTGVGGDVTGEKKEAVSRKCNL